MQIGDFKFIPKGQRKKGRYGNSKTHTLLVPSSLLLSLTLCHNYFKQFIFLVVNEKLDAPLEGKVYQISVEFGILFLISKKENQADDLVKQQNLSSFLFFSHGTRASETAN